MDKRLDNWCDTALGQVRCWMDHSRIRAELEAHIEDRCAALEELDYPPELAAERTLAAMGDPVEVGRTLDREHPVWIGWLWLVSVVAVFLMAIVVVIEVQESSGMLERFWDRIAETVAPIPPEERWPELDENFDAQAAYGFDYTCTSVCLVKAGNSPSAYSTSIRSSTMHQFRTIRKARLLFLFLMPPPPSPPAASRDDRRRAR